MLLTYLSDISFWKPGRLGIVSIVVPCYSNVIQGPAHQYPLGAHLQGTISGLAQTYWSRICASTRSPGHRHVKGWTSALGHSALLKDRCLPINGFQPFWAQTPKAPQVAQWLKKNLAAVQEMWIQSLGREDLLEEEMATHCSVLAWRIP